MDVLNIISELIIKQNPPPLLPSFSPLSFHNRSLQFPRWYSLQHPLASASQVAGTAWEYTVPGCITDLTTQKRNFGRGVLLSGRVFAFHVWGLSFMPAPPKVRWKEKRKIGEDAILKHADKEWERLERRENPLTV